MAKFIDNRSITGQKGINLIEKIVLDMGFLWHPTGAIEAGIDGNIERRKDSTGETLGNFIYVQSKALSNFVAEAPNSFAGFNL